MNIQIISYPQHLQKHVSEDTVNEFERALLEDGCEQKFIGDLQFTAGKIAGKFPAAMKLSSILKIARLTDNGDQHNFSVFMGHDFKKALIPFLCKKNNSAYFFDAWPSRHQKIENFIRTTELKNVFFSSRQVADAFIEKNLSCRVQWLPEAVAIENYKALSYEQKDIDVLYFGRKFLSLHDKIAEPLLSAGYRYLFEKKQGEIIFPDRDSFIHGLASAKISVCIPGNVTNPAMTGDISTMTVRYLQSMASKALVVGIMPEEMQALFDYEAVISINMEDPFGHIRDILNNYDDYIPLIERNYNHVRLHHTWRNRWQAIKRII